MGRKDSDTVSRERAVIFVGSDKGGVSKSFTSALVFDLLDMAGRQARIVQIDEQDRLPNLFPGLVTTVTPARLDDLRRDPGAIVAAFDPLYAAIERLIADGGTLIVDIGGPQQTLLEEYAALVDLDADLVEAGVNALWLAPAVAEPEAMRGAVRTAAAISRVLPSAHQRIVLNGRDGDFRFYPGSPADKIWQEALLPLTQISGSIRVPAIAPGSWLPFEGAGKRFIDVIAAEITTIQSWTGRSRPAAKVLRGDVAAFLAAADEEFRSALGLSAVSHDER